MTFNLISNAFILLLLRSIVCAGALAGDRVLFKVKFIENITHPVAMFGELAAWGAGFCNRFCNRLCNKKTQKHSHLFRSSNMWRGLLWSVSLLLLVSLLGAGLEWLLATTVYIFVGAGGWGWGGGAVGLGFLLLAHSFICAWLIAQAQLDGYVAKVECELRAKKLGAARKTLAHIVGRQTSALSSQAVARAAMESLAENSSDATIAPLIYYMLCGLPGLLFSKAVNTLDSQFGYRGARYGEFGSAAARIDDVANLLPARITAYGICLVALFMRASSGLSAFRAKRRFAPSVLAWLRGGLRGSPNAPHPEAALAGALGIKLAGKRVYKMFGETWQVGEWIGFGSENCNYKHIACARRLVNYTILFFVMILIFTLLAIVWRFGLWSYPFSSYLYYL